MIYQIEENNYKTIYNVSLPDKCISRIPVCCGESTIVTDGPSKVEILVSPKSSPGPRGKAMEWSDLTPSQKAEITPTISVGNTTTLPAGSDASVTDVGTDKNHILDFAIPRGNDGPQGQKGDKGDKGDTGPQGPQGIQGPKGDKGDQGIQGIQGIQGEKGETGERGPQGETGPQGIQGEKGDKGDTGAQGPQGEVGPTGPRGPQGEQGIQGETGPQGDKGDKGDTGPQGPQGEQGIQGIQGPQGDTGLQGPKGDTGLQGPQGIQGPQGPQGPAGEDGVVQDVQVSYDQGQTWQSAMVGSIAKIITGTGGGGGGGEMNTIEVIQKNGTNLPIVNKVVNVTVPTSTSQLTNDSGFLTQQINADWNETSATSSSYIRNKPALVTPGYIGGGIVEAASAITSGYADSAGYIELNNVGNADDLKAIEALSGTSGLLRKTAANTWTLDTTAYAPTSSVPTATSDLTNDSGFITNAPIEKIAVDGVIQPISNRTVNIVLSESNIQVHTPYLSYNTLEKAWRYTIPSSSIGTMRFMTFEKDIPGKETSDPYIEYHFQIRAPQGEIWWVSTSGVEWNSVGNVVDIDPDYVDNSWFLVGEYRQDSYQSYHYKKMVQAIRVS